MESSQSVFCNRVLACSALVQTNNAFFATKSFCRKPQHFLEFRLGVQSGCIFTDEQTWVCCWAGPMLLMLWHQLVNFQLEPNRLRLYFRLGTWISQQSSLTQHFVFIWDVPDGPAARGTTCSESPRREACRAGNDPCTKLLLNHGKVGWCTPGRFAHVVLVWNGRYFPHKTCEFGLKILSWWSAVLWFWVMLELVVMKFHERPISFLFCSYSSYWADARDP